MFSVPLGLTALLTLSAVPGTEGIDPQASSSRQPIVESFPNSMVKLKMNPIPGGKITIRGKEVEVKAFAIGETEVVWDLFDLFLMSGPPSKPYDQTEFPADAIARPSRSYNTPDLGWGRRGWPAININFDTAVMFCRWLSQATGKTYRLPTEAEWELAARGGVSGAWTPLDKAGAEAVSWYGGNADERTHPVAKKAPNGFGLFDMLGNAGEWALDLEGKPILCGPTFRDPLANVTPLLRKRYNPDWQESDPQMPKSRWWLSDGPIVGFRVVTEG